MSKEIRQMIDQVKSFKQFVNENKTYDELISLEKWYDEENKKLDNVKDFKTWKLKSKLLQKQFLNY